MKNRTRQWINTVSFSATILINLLANILPIGIGKTGAIAEKYPNLFAPAPVTFSIWGVIYLLMTGFILYGWGVFGRRKEAERDLEKIGPWFAISCFCNIGWIFAWHFDRIPLSVVLIVGLLITLAVIGHKIGETGRNGLSYIAVHAGFDLYFGWVIAAVIVNITVLLVKIRWNGFGLSPVFWTAGLLIIGAVIGALPMWIDRKYCASLAVVWAYIGILIRHIGKSGYDGAYPIVIAFAAAGIALLLSAVMLKKTANTKE